MAERITGTGLFFGAITDLLRHPGAVLRITALTVLVYLLIEIPLAKAYVGWFNSTSLAPAPPGDLISTICFFLLLGVLATSWHRFMILDEAPAGFVPRIRIGLIGRYILAWIVIGIIAGLIVIVGFFVPVFIIGSLIDPLFGQIVLSVFDFDPYFTPGPTGAFYTFAAGTLALALVIYLYVLFRMGMGMPSVAIRDGQGLGMRASWRATRGIARPILGLTLLAAIGQVLLSGAGYGTLVLGGAFGPDVITFASEYATRIGLVVTDTINTLIGAAILTRVYRALPLDDAA